MNDRLRWMLHATLMVIVTGPAFAASKYTAPKDGVAQVSCTCTLGFSGCELKVLDSLSQKQRITWIQPASLKRGSEYNLDQMCYRKRDVKGLGEGLCCEATKESDSIEKLFRGEIKK